MQTQIHVKGLVHASRLRVIATLVLEDLDVIMMEVCNRVTDRLHHTVSRQQSRLVKIDRAGIRQGNLVAAMS